MSRARDILTPERRKAKSKRRRAAIKAQRKARYERFVAIAGPQTEGIAKNFCSCGGAQHLTAVGVDSNKRALYQLVCTACGAIAT